jgi:hypothetical protein
MNMEETIDFENERIFWSMKDPAELAVKGRG